MTYIEEYLEYLCNEKLDSLQSVDAIYFSIYKQTVRGLGLTDRQYSLVLKKIQQYVTVDELPTKIPLRSIDRSKYIKLVETIDVYGQDTVYESYKTKWKWIKVRFPFSKKDIVKIDSIQIKHSEYFHKKGSHEHYYKFTPKNLYNIISALQTRNFDIEQQLLDYYKKVENIKNTKFDLFETCLPEDVKQSILSMNKTIYADRRLRYGYNVEHVYSDTLIDTIAYRKQHEVCLDPKVHTMQSIVETITQLERFPLIVLIDEDTSFLQLRQIHAELSKVVDNKYQSVLFRIDSKDDNNCKVNDYIKDNELNNWVDNSTKVVYIKKNKLPKVLLQSDFQPICALAKTSTRCNKNVRLYMQSFCDCILYHDQSLSLFRRIDGIV